MDYEGELAVILGCDARDVAEHDARSVIAAVTCANDVSQRWWQWHGGGSQWCRGKSFDSFCPLGDPTPISGLDDLQDLQLTTRLNGEVVQRASTATMIFPVARLIAELSQGTTLLAGTVILTGTPAGVGAGRKPPRFLRDGEILSEGSLNQLRAFDAILLGAVGTPEVPPGVIERGLLLKMRFELDLYINQRPFIGTGPGHTKAHDFVVIRENTEGP